MAMCVREDSRAVTGLPNVFGIIKKASPQRFLLCVALFARDLLEARRIQLTAFTATRHFRNPCTWALSNALCLSLAVVLASISECSV